MYVFSGYLFNFAWHIYTQNHVDPSDYINSALRPLVLVRFSYLDEFA
jgi:hypothetical protein